jgi:tetratricopeptide (TPR) repeat protein
MKNVSGIVCLGLLVQSTLYNAEAQSSKVVNLLSVDRAQLVEGLSTAASIDLDKHLRDGDKTTSQRISGSLKAPAEFVYFLGDSVVAPKEFRFRLGSTAAKGGEIEVLASTLSSSAGFTSLRNEPIRPSSSWQSLSFEENAARWLLVRVIPASQGAPVEIADMELRGRAGPPKTHYEFKESPANAIEVLAKLKSAVETNISDEEASLFEDAADGRFDTWSFAEAALLSAGASTKAERQEFLRRIDALEQSARKAVSTASTPFEKGEFLLKWLHKGPMKGGYVSAQTDVSEILRSKTYNCVSSATLYNILALRLGLDARAIEVPDHAFSIVYDGTQTADVETTTKGGFNPSRNRSSLKELKQTTGFNYIPDKHRSKRREVGEAGLVALTYYNHGVSLTEKKKYYPALLNYFRALSLDPENKSAVKNALSVLGNWSYTLSQDNQFDKALSVLDVGLELAPKDRTLKHNYKAVWQKKVESVLDTGEPSEALDSLKQAYAKTQDKDFIKLQSWVFLRKGEKLLEDSQWEEALSVADEGMKIVDSSAQSEIEKWRSGVILRWSNEAIQKKDYQTATDVLARGLDFKKKDYRIENNLGYVAQEWSAHVAKTQGPAEAEEVLASLVQRFPQLRKVKRAASGFVDRNAQKAIKLGDYEQAVKIYETARLNNPDDSHIKRNEVATWVSWAKPELENKQWDKALDIYEQAYRKRPDARVILQNIAYIVQEWSREVAKKQGVSESEKLVSTLAARFPNLDSLQKAKGRNVAVEVQDLIKKKEYSKAEKMIESHADQFGSKRDLEGLVVNLYYYWGRAFSEKKQWPEAVEVYNRAMQIHPSNSKLKRNAIATWHSWAQLFLDSEEWQKAIDVYEKGLLSIPNASLFKRNIKYCKSKLAKF